MPWRRRRDAKGAKEKRSDLRLLDALGAKQVPFQAITRNEKDPHSQRGRGSAKFYENGARAA